MSNNAYIRCVDSRPFDRYIQVRNVMEDKVDQLLVPLLTNIVYERLRRLLLA